MNNKELRLKAKVALKEKWWMAVGAALLYSIIIGTASNVAIVGVIFLGYPMIYGLAKYNMAIVQGYGDFDDLFSGFRENYMDNVITILLQQVFIFLWTLLLIIPGIVKSIAYAMTPYILVDRDYELLNMEAIHKSEALMLGYKWKYFKMMLFFVLLHLIGLFTLGIFNILYVAPYQYNTIAQFYFDVKTQDKTINNFDKVVHDDVPEIKKEDEWDF